jgi:hypothetical protein
MGQRHDLGDEIGGMRPDDMNPQKLIIARLAHDLDEAFVLAGDARLAAGGEETSRCGRHIHERGPSPPSTHLATSGAQ